MELNHAILARMKSRVLAVVAMFAVAGLLSGCQIWVDPETGDFSTKVGWPKASLAPDATCEMTSCHGLDIECGAEAPEACTLEYRLGDFCRKYADCAVVEGQCLQVESRLFTECKSCVELCDSGIAGDSPDKAFTCEDECRQQVETLERSL